MLIREHRGSLKSSMSTVKEIPATKEAIAKHAKSVWKLLPNDIDLESIEVEKYGDYDDRIGWDTHIVLINGQVFGMTDGPLDEYGR